MADYLVKKIEDKQCLWFKNTNNYLQLEEDVYKVFEQLQKGKSKEEIALWCEGQFVLSEEDAADAVNDIVELISEQMEGEPFSYADEIFPEDHETPAEYYSSKSYRFKDVYFQFHYADAKIETMFHPLFAHLENKELAEPVHQLKLFIRDDNYVLNLDGNYIGSWYFDEDHVFKGQVFMALLNLAYNKTEKDWMAVLHASAIGNDKQSVFFLGDSGNGKSTASAIALASGLSLIADDFVPLDTNAQVLAFPAAISVKKQALSFLSDRFPALLKAKEYELKAMNKTVRYLAPPERESNSPRKVKALVFIKFDKKVDFELKTMDRQKAFQHLVVDAWLSPEEENAQGFLDWIANIPMYSLTYSNNEKMVEAVKGLVNGK